MVVLTPTRELALQIAGECTKLRNGSGGLRSVVVYGGVPKEEQAQLLDEKKPHVLVGTPGRLLDLVDSKILDLSAVSYLVIDEADKMLSLGFQPQLQRLRDLLMPAVAQPVAAAVAAPVPPAVKGKKGKKGAAADVAAVVVVEAVAAAPRPQVMLFTATMPEEVKQAAASWLTDGEVVEVGHSADSISRTITQASGSDLLGFRTSDVDAQDGRTLKPNTRDESGS